MEKSPAHRPVTSLLIILIFGVFILGTLVVVQNREMRRRTERHEQEKMEKEISDAMKNPSALKVLVDQPMLSGITTETGSNIVMVEREFVMQGGPIKITQACDGTVTSKKREGDEPFKHCVGKNVLKFEDGTRTKIIASSIALTDEESPVFDDIQLVGSNTKTPRLIIAYEPNACLTAHIDCPEIGGPTYVKHGWVFNVGDLTVRKIAEYQENTKAPVWNAAGTKALVIQDTCGEGGCIQLAIIGYDLDRDIAKSVTTQEATGGQYADAEMPRPRWESVAWKTNTSFVATMLLKDGTKKAVAGKF